jgi:acetyl coenzyme A synthetase (ADP forming)-like protein
MNSPAVGIDAVRTDGTLVHLRAATPDDLAALTLLHERASERSLYLRFFGLGHEPARQHVPLLASDGSAEHGALVAELDDRLVGVAEFKRVSDADAEIALLVEDAQQGSGIGTLLTEHLAQIARSYGYRRFLAEALAENTNVLRLLVDLGLPVRRSYTNGTVTLTIDLELDATAMAASDRREALADAASLRALLAPRSVAVVGASTRSNSVGHQVLRNIVDAGFTGLVYAVNPHCDSVLGVPAVANPADLPVAVDLAVVAVPASQVPGVVAACGRRGVRGLVLLSSGFGETGPAGRDLEGEVLELARRFGMRLIGPNCLGVLNTDPQVRLNATFAALPMQAGALGLASQSGALGIAVAEAAARSGVGVAAFVSVGNKADVSGNDLLMSFEHDPRVKVIALYLESFGNPRKFARIARRISATKPIIAIKGGRTPAGERAGRSHTAAAASSNVVVDALFEQAGVLRVDTMPELLDAARVLATQPVPAGPRLAIVGNSGGPQILAADAAFGAGLQVVPLSDQTVRALRERVPGAASYANPVDLGAAADQDRVGRAVQVLLAADEVDAVLTVFTETAVGDPAAVLARVAEVAAGATKPVIATQVGGTAGITPERADSAAVPVFAFPEPAARALGVACRYARIRRSPAASLRRPAGTDAAAARALVASAVAEGTQWLPPERAAALLVHYGIEVCPQRLVRDADQAAEAAPELGYPLVVKAADGGLHKTELGAVRVGIADEHALRCAVADVLSAVPESRVLLQPVVPPGTELILGALQDPRFGPVVMVGAGGVLADVLADRCFALAPLDEDAALRLIDRLRIAPLLDGYRGRPVVPRAAVAELVTCVAQLVDDVPQIAELDLNPVICNGDSLVAVDARIRVAPAPDVPDPVLRQLATR